MRHLRSKLQMPVEAVMRQEQALAWPEERLDRKSMALEQEELGNKRSRLVRWRERMQEMKEAAKWVKNKARASTRLISGALERKSVKRFRSFGSLNVAVSKRKPPRRRSERAASPPPPK